MGNDRRTALTTILSPFLNKNLIYLIDVTKKMHYFFTVPVIMLTVFRTLNTLKALNAERLVEEPDDTALTIIVIQLS